MLKIIYSNIKCELKFQDHLANCQSIFLKFSKFLGFCLKTADFSKILSAWGTSLAFLKPSHTKEPPLQVLCILASTQLVSHRKTFLSSFSLSEPQKGWVWIGLMFLLKFQFKNYLQHLLNITVSIRWDFVSIPKTKDIFPNWELFLNWKFTIMCGTVELATILILLNRKNF